ncbi:sulfite exporter TauE/SafE family protein [Breoghania sp. JC706]|uniref:sulfite exporter TauE/SafE family protein n=1 Tax=Breoghania sp. JC706 TaxID=3117732 RepID=UPI00300BD113
MLSEFLPSFSDPTVLLVCLAAAVGGAVRGFAGFGGAMIFMPVASAVIDPRLAAAAFLVMDDILALPMAVRAVRICDWRTILPAVAAAMLTVPLGAAVLAHSDPRLLRWGISLLVLALLALLVSGWRYKGRPTLPISCGVGMTSGFLSGVSQISGPPVIAFWMSGPSAAPVIRANLIVYFAISSLGAFAAFWWNGFFTMEVARLLVVLMPANAVALFIGTRLFTFASEKTFRRVAYTLVALAALGSLPALDGVLR